MLVEMPAGTPDCGSLYIRNRTCGGHNAPFLEDIRGWPTTWGDGRRTGFLAPNFNPAVMAPGSATGYRGPVVEPR